MAVVVVLTLGGMLEATVHQGTQELSFQKEVLETGSMDTHIMAFATPFTITLALMMLSMGE